MDRKQKTSVRVKNSIQREVANHVLNKSIPYNMNGLVESESFTSKLDFNTLTEGENPQEPSLKDFKGRKGAETQGWGGISHLVSVKDNVMQ